MAPPPGIGSLEDAAMFHPPKKYRHRDVKGHRLQPETLMMGYGYDPQFSEGSVKPPIFQTSTFAFKSAEDGKSFFELAYGLREQGPAEEPGLIYSRVNNPDLEILEDRLGLWESAESGLSFSSGMAAISTTMFSVLRPGDVLLASEPVYGGTEFLFEHILPQFGVQCIWFGSGRMGPSLAEAVEKAKPLGRIAMLYVETPANPTNGLVDIAQCAAAAHSLAGADGRRPLVAVDNTFLGPLWQHPLQHGADFTLYSLTKYVGGHSDLIAGACLGNESVIAPVRGMRTILGTISDPHTCWLLLRSLETMKLRMTSAMKNARYVAEFLADHPKVKTVQYLGFLEPGDPQYDLYQRQCHAPGSTFSFEIHGGETDAFRMLNALQVIKLAVSLGGTETLIEHPATMTHSDIPPPRQLEMGITPSMIRVSVGIENPQDIIADLDQALEAV
jgi:methionine-gamma-lyase